MTASPCPLIAGSLIAAAGLAFGSVSVASAQAAHHAPPPSIAQQAAKVKAEDAYTPVDGNAELNVNVLEDQVEHYYGSASAAYPGVGTVTISSSTSVYARQMKQIVAAAEAYLAQAASHYHGPGRPAVVFDIDDTLLSTYDCTLAEQFGYTSASNLIWVDDAAFPAVFHMPPRPPARRPSTSRAPASTSPPSATPSWPTSATSTATCSAATPDTRSSCRTRCTTSPDRPAAARGLDGRDYGRDWG